MRFENKTVLATGGNSGIGLAVAREVIAEGARVIVTGRDQAALDRAAKELGPKAKAFKADASNLADVQKVVDLAHAEFGQLNGLFANAGAAIFGPVDQVTEKTYDQLMDLNVKGVFPHVNAVCPGPIETPLWRKQGGLPKEMVEVIIQTRSWRPFTSWLKLRDCQSPCASPNSPRILQGNFMQGGSWTLSA